MPFTIVGIGLVPRDISVRGLEAVRSADRVFLDGYTSIQVAEGLGEVIDVDFTTIQRLTIESEDLIAQAVENDIVLMVPGDGLTATTHDSLVQGCRERGIEVTVIPGISIAVVVPGILGLQWYKFGRATTIPIPRDGYMPESPYDVIAENLERGLHTLVLLDIDPPGPMTASEGLRYLSDLEARLGKGAGDRSLPIAIVARAGAEDQTAVFGPLSDLIELDVGLPPHSIVVPGKLHFMEEGSLMRFAINP